MCLLLATSPFNSPQGSLLPDPSTPVSPLYVCCTIYLNKRKTQPLCAMFPTLFPYRLLSEMDPDQRDLWPELRSSLWCSSQQHRQSCRDNSAAQTAVVKGLQSSQMHKETCLCGEIWAEVTMIYKHLLSYRAGNCWIILILPDMSTLKLVNLIPASLNSPSCMLRRTNFFFQKGIPSRC